ncbi:Nramp family divalent metal transporter [Phenylobacterium deserti]|uniref:Divalent metal cation transporter MntH n=1 Tax=Phenylobacterium deserti TaxID=1914756 RepID=A0A328ANE4_9CAUL|nr:Nramp family divalent metal transporter [Phenylobacterium deserti]RAK56523.1 divalent metal cation transporter [Phenylobacterium deserti]
MSRINDLFRLPTTATAPFCPSEVRGVIATPEGANLWKRIATFAGPGLLVAVGYMDPGNWATDIEAGSRLGTDLLFIIGLSSLGAILFQCLALRLGLVTGRDLAQACADRYAGATRIFLWVLAEIAIIATDVAEVLGAALAFKLLLGLPLWGGVLLTALDLLFVLGLQGVGFRKVEAIILALVATIGGCFLLELILARPDAAAVAHGMIPDLRRLEQPHALYLAIGIVGATIMPHNLYLHSSIVQTRRVGAEQTGQAVRLATADTVVSLLLAMLVNGSILLLAATAFHANGHTEIADIEDAHRLLEPITGAALAGVAFALALLASGQSSTFTGTIAGQVVLEGFLNLKIPCWQRRVITRVLAVVPALAGVLILGEGSVGRLLVFTQVILAAQLPFALYPLVRLTSDKQLMGRFVTPAAFRLLAWGLFSLLTAADIWLVAKIGGGLLA